LQLCVTYAPRDRRRAQVLLHESRTAMAAFLDLRLTTDRAPSTEDDAAICFTLQRVPADPSVQEEMTRADDLILSVRRGAELRELRSRSPRLHRALEKGVARLLALAPREKLTMTIWISIEPFARGAGPPKVAWGDPGPRWSLRKRIEAFERTIIALEFEAAGRNQSETARRLGISRPALIGKLHKYGFKRA
jgi:hypothetical protein